MSVLDCNKLDCNKLDCIHSIIDYVNDVIIHTSENDSPQIIKGRSQDIHKGIHSIGRFMNPRHPSYIFKQERVHVFDTVIYLMVLKNNLELFASNFVPKERVIQDHFRYLHEYINTIIKFIVKKGLLL